MKTMMIISSYISHEGTLKYRMWAILQDNHLRFDIFHNKKPGENTNITKLAKSYKAK